MAWQFSLVVWYAAVIGQSLFQRTYAANSRLPPAVPPALSYLLAVSPLGIIIGLLLPHHITWNAPVVGLLIAEGIFIGLFNWLMFRALRDLPIAKFQLVYQFYAIVVVALGWIFLAERLNAMQLLGGVLLIAAAYIALRAPKTNQQQLRTKTDKAALLITLCAAIALGIGLVAEKATLRYMDIGAYFIVGFSTQTLTLVVLALSQTNRRALRGITRHDLVRSWIMGVLSALTGFAYIYALRASNNISLITVLCAFNLPLTIIAAYLFLRERENVKVMILAALIGSLGIVITAL